MSKVLPYIGTASRLEFGEAYGDDKWSALMWLVQALVPGAELMTSSHVGSAEKPVTLWAPDFPKQVEAKLLVNQLRASSAGFRDSYAAGVRQRKLRVVQRITWEARTHDGLDFHYCLTREIGENGQMTDYCVFIPGPEDTYGFTLGPSDFLFTRRPPRDP